MSYPYDCVLIVAQQGPLRDSIRALVTTSPRIKVIGETDDFTTALEMVSQSIPDLVVVDSNFPIEQVWLFLRQVKKKSPRTSRLMLANTVEEKQEIEAPSAETVCLKGASPLELMTYIEKLLAVSVVAC